jgi:hypothetical protein
MAISPSYDPESQPDAETWLSLDEQERIALAERYHRQARIDLPSVTAHAAVHAIVENQIALGVDSVMRAVPRLMRQGLSRHDAIHAVASVLTRQLYEQANAKERDSAVVVQARYDAEVERLSAREWRATHGAQ